MYDIIKTVISSGRYELSDMLKKIDTIWLQGSLTGSQKSELEGLARQNALPENSYASVQKQLNSIYANLGELAAAIKANTDAITLMQGGTVTPPVKEEYPEYIQPTGAHDAYNTGDRMTYTDGRRYVCRMDGCVWDPDTYPDAWELVEEETDPEAETGAEPETEPAE